MTKVIYYTTKKEENPVEDFLNSLNERQQRKLLRVINHVMIYGLESVISHLKKLSGAPLWEIRILGKDNIRVIYTSIQNADVLLLHGFVKKVQKTPNREMEIALKRLKDWENSP